MLQGVRLFKQSSITMHLDGQVIYFDPYKLYHLKREADFVFVTHTHGDHFSLADIKGVLKPDGVLIVPLDLAADMKAKGTAADFADIIAVEPGGEYEVKGLRFETVPAYNLAKSYHPKANGWVGYIVHPNNGYSYYFAGDTDLIPEMKGIEADVAFLPVGGTYTMDAAEAARAANLIKPAVAVPIHYYDVVGTLADAEKFVSLLDSGIKGEIIKEFGD